MEFKSPTWFQESTKESKQLPLARDKEEQSDREQKQLLDAHVKTSNRSI